MKTDPTWIEFVRVLGPLFLCGFFLGANFGMWLEHRWIRRTLRAKGLKL